MPRNYLGVQTENFATVESSEEIIKKGGDLDIEENSKINCQIFIWCNKCVKSYSSGNHLERHS